MTAISDFVANPRTFLRRNVLRARFQAPDTPTHTRDFKFELKTYSALRFANGTQVPCYDILPLGDQEALICSRDPTSPNRNYLKGYWCPYDAGQQHSIMVDNAADFMFTTNMDGCSFGVGSQTPTGARRVSHINLWGVVPGNSRTAQNATLALQQLDRHLVAPDAYMQSPLVPGAINGEIKITTYGMRNVASGHWSFWYQQYRILGNNDSSVVLLDVIRP